MHLRKEEYLAQFEDPNERKTKSTEASEKKKLALDRAWKNRDFEIELYWKRAAYFWTFLVATFAGYFAVMKSDSNKFPQAEFVIICLGIIFSFAWYLVNRGSKKWQENWEKHIDMLEEDVTGNLYKSVIRLPGFSVSKINLKVSFFVFLIWLLLAARYILHFVGINQCVFSSKLGCTVWIFGLLTLFFLLSLLSSVRVVDDISHKNSLSRFCFKLLVAFKNILGLDISKKISFDCRLPEYEDCSVRKRKSEKIKKIVSFLKIKVSKIKHSLSFTGKP